jgi:hypothetical protein
MSESKLDRDSSSPHPPSLSTTTPEKKPTDAANTKVSPSKDFVHAIRDFMRPPPWVINNIHKRKSQKLLFRSCLASWATLILLLCNPSLRTIGNLYVQANSSSCVISCVLIGAIHHQWLFWDTFFYAHPSRLSCTNLHSRMSHFSKVLLPVLTTRAGIQLVLQLLLGLLTGWGIGSAAMKAAISVRSYLVDEATLQNAVNRSAS